MPVWLAVLIFAGLFLFAMGVAVWMVLFVKMWRQMMEEWRKYS